MVAAMAGLTALLLAVKTDFLMAALMAVQLVHHSAAKRAARWADVKAG